MGADNYFSLITLPVLDPPPADPPLGLGALLERVPAGRPRELVRCVVLSDDLLQREATLAGELPRPEPAVLTLQQATGEDPLPPSLERAPETPGPGPRIAADAVWSAYYRWAHRRASDLDSPFLQQWVVWEVSTRNALAAARARILGLDPEEYRVARSLSDSSADADALVNGWSSAAQPLDAFRGLLAARWRWVDEHEPWFTFRDDEYGGYAAKLVLLHRWLRASEFGPQRHAEGIGEAVS